MRTLTLGGVSDLHGGTVDGKPVGEWVAARVSALDAAANVEVLTRTTAVGHFHHNYVLLFERLGDDNPAAPARGRAAPPPVEGARAPIVLATGALERPIPFANNDRPGVMLATAARGFASRYGVSPGAAGVVFTNNDDAYRTALHLKQAGVTIAAIVDSRARATARRWRKRARPGLRIEPGSALTGLVSARGGKEIEAVKVSGYRSTGTRVLSEEKIACDWVAVSGGFNPVVHLWCHNGGKLAWDDRIASYKPGQHHDAIAAAGAASGVFDLKSCIESGYAAGDAGAGKAERTFAVIEASARGGDGADLVRARKRRLPDRQQALHRLPERRDGGRPRTRPARGLHLGRTHQALHHAGRWRPTRARPPISRAGRAVAGDRQIGAGDRHHHVPSSVYAVFVRLDRRAAHEGAVPAGAADAGVRLARGERRDVRAGGPVAARRTATRRPAETKEQAIHREVLAVRRKVGILDASTLGKIEIKGPDAAPSSTGCTRTFSPPCAVGKCRYGLMLNELGFLTDDGVTVRLADDHFLMHTTSGGADRSPRGLRSGCRPNGPTCACS